MSEAQDMMDVDQAPLATGGTQDDGRALTMPVSVGPREVHIPVAGFAQSVAVPVDVDEAHDAPVTSLAPKTPAAPSHPSQPRPCRRLRSPSRRSVARR